MLWISHHTFVPDYILSPPEGPMRHVSQLKLATARMAVLEEVTVD